VTQLRQLMLEELQRRNYSKTTARIYVRSVKRVRRVFRSLASKAWSGAY